VTEKNDSPEGEFEEANNRLSEGLKSCRAVVSNYRSLLAGESVGEPDPVGPETADADEELRD